MNDCELCFHPWRWCIEACGVPLMGECFQVVEDLLWTGAVRPEDKEAFELVLRGRSQLQAVLAKARFDVRNLEAVFTAFEMAQLFGELGSLQQHEIDALTSSMRQVIVSTIEHKMVFNVGMRRIGPTADYRWFGKMVSLLVDKGEQFSFITFNYDVGLEVALAFYGFQVDYCFNPQPDLPSKGQKILELMKLHGSISWAECADCRAIVPKQVFGVVSGMEQQFGHTAHPPERVMYTAFGSTALVMDV